MTPHREGPVDVGVIMPYGPGYARKIGYAAIAEEEWAHRQEVHRLSQAILADWRKHGITLQYRR